MALYFECRINKNALLPVSLSSLISFAESK